MLSTDQNQFFEAALFHSTGIEQSVKSITFLSGGCINNSIKLVSTQGCFFLKWNESKPLDFFEAEASGLDILRRAGAIRVPEVIGLGEIGGKAFLMLEFLESRYPLPDYWEQFGASLAKLHRQSHTHFGLNHANYIGALPQTNDFTENWLDFFIEKRLRVQFGLAMYKGLTDDRFLKQLDALRKALEGFFPKEEKPALIHGDLWSGNAMTGSKGEPVIIDPSVHYANREMELAFTKLFGGFDDRFYHAYQEAFPMAPGFKDRTSVYNLYPLMVHVNLFGLSYLSGVEAVLKRFL